MPHQAEDIFSHAPECQRCGLESILLSEWPKGNAKWINQPINDKWDEILKAREIVNRAIEPLRIDKKVGSSLEVAVYLQIDCPEITAAFKTVENELSSIFITSQAFIADAAPEGVLNTHEEGIFKVYVIASIGEKCDRCWKYRALNVDSDNPTICQECLEAISE